LEDGSQLASGASDDESEGEDEADEPLPAEDAVQQPAVKNNPVPEKKKESEKAGKGRSEPGERLGDASVKLGATLPAFLRQRCSQELKPKPALLVWPSGATSEWSSAHVLRDAPYCTMEEPGGFVLLCAG
jgi:hypothetical protein